MANEFLGRSSEQDPSREMDKYTASRTLPLVLFPGFTRPQDLIKPLQDLDRNEVIRVLSEKLPGEQYSYLEQRTRRDYHAVSPEDMIAMQTTLEHVGTLRKAVALFAGLYLLKQNDWAKAELMFIELTPDKPFNELGLYQEFLRAVLKKLIVEAPDNGGTDPLVANFIDNFSGFTVMQMFEDVIDENGNTPGEKILWREFKKRNATR